MKIFIICIIIIICILSLFTIVYCSGIKYKNNFINGGKRLIDPSRDDPSGWQLYLSKKCDHCINQKKRLNNFHTYAEYDNGKLITNNIKSKLYPIHKIKAFPFWYNTKTKKIKLGDIDPCKLSPKPNMCKQLHQPIRNNKFYV